MSFQTCSKKSKYQDTKKNHEEISRLWQLVLNRIKNIVKRDTRFYSFFGLLFFLEGSFLFSLFFSLRASVWLTYVLAGFFLTIFSFMMLRLYFETTRGDLLEKVGEEYLSACKEIISYQENVIEHSVVLANIIHKLAINLQDYEYNMLYFPVFFKKRFVFLTRQISCLCFWKDIFKLREYLFTEAIKEHVKVVQMKPTDLGAHATLANAYVLLSGLYADPRKYPEYDRDHWIPKERYSDVVKKKFRLIAEKAIEEFKILNDYAPGNPWVHIQLAYSYHDLQMPKEEIKEYELVLELRPDDLDSMFKLGILYFQQGMNSKGLRIYEELKKKNLKKSKQLINFYGFQRD